MNVGDFRDEKGIERSVKVLYSSTSKLVRVTFINYFTYIYISILWIL